MDPVESKSGLIFFSQANYITIILAENLEKFPKSSGSDCQPNTHLESRNSTLHRHSFIVYSENMPHTTGDN